ncbi:DUF4411 family protein [Bacillus thuringiensis]|uniref:DUF4411 family protein n=1 Tax=Bacillus thuringiensis TaxID=1428 RepID=UPI0021D68A5A|nr:DUF4411 family protein [Bacillus thuringiensis]MCU7667738.1 DUF4411 family protein [Bacillus thuringiensis]
MAELKKYLVDTVAVRYRVNKDYKKPVRRFWTKALEEVGNGEAVLLIPEEVFHELEIQSFGFSAHNNKKELDNIANVLEQCNVVPNITSTEIEHQLRKMAAYVRGNYKEDIDAGKGIEYPGVSDSRILCTAWRNDCVVVTANIKDFMLLPLLDAPGEEILYDIVSSKYITVTEEAHQKIHSDETFKTMFRDLVKMVEKIEDSET